MRRTVGEISFVTVNNMVGKYISQQWWYGTGVRSLKEKRASSLLTDVKHALFMLVPHWTGSFSRRRLCFLYIFTYLCLYLRVAMQLKSDGLMDEWHVSLLDFLFRK